MILKIVLKNKGLEAAEVFMNFIRDGLWENFSKILEGKNLKIDSASFEFKSDGNNIECTELLGNFEKSYKITTAIYLHCSKKNNDKEVLLKSKVTTVNTNKMTNTGNDKEVPYHKTHTTFRSTKRPTTGKN